MAQRSIEVLVGRIATDEAFRRAFLEDMATAIATFTDQGHELTVVEISALRAVAPAVWVRVAREIDPRLQKASLSSGRQE